MHWNRTVRALVAYEASLGDPLTSEGIVKKYGLDCGTYSYAGEEYGEGGKVVDKAEQLVRNHLARAYREGDLVKLRDHDGHLVRKGRYVVYQNVVDAVIARTHHPVYAWKEERVDHPAHRG